MCDWSVLLRRLSSQFILTHRPHTEFMIGLHLRLSKYPKEGFLLINGSLVADVRLDVGFNKCSLTFSREIFFSPSLSLSLSLSPVYAKQIRFCFDVIPVHPVRRQPCGPPIKKRPHLSTVFVLIRLGVFKYICHTQGKKKKRRFTSDWFLVTILPLRAVVLTLLVFPFICGVTFFSLIVLDVFKTIRETYCFLPASNQL